MGIIIDQENGIDPGGMADMISQWWGRGRQVIVPVCDTLDGDTAMRYYPVIEGEDGPNHPFVILAIDQNNPIDLREEDLR
jgi:hypothetical protein